MVDSATANIAIIIQYINNYYLGIGRDKMYAFKYPDNLLDEFRFVRLTATLTPTPDQ